MQLLICLFLAVVGLAGGYRWLWRRRYGPTGIEGHYLRLTGRVAGPGRPGRLVYSQNSRGEPLDCGPFTLQTGDGQRHEVDPSGSQVALHGGAIRVGDTVVVDATHGTIHVDEALYRDAALRPALCALRLVRGEWPALRWLDPLIATAALGAVALALTVPLAPARKPNGSLGCPRGTRQGGVQGKTQWCEEDRGIEAVVGGQDAVEHGPFVVWWDHERVRQRGQYEAGRASGRWLTWHRSGRLAVDARYSRGQRTGSWTTWRADGTLREQGTYDRRGWRHGAWHTYYADGKLALLRLYRHGKRHGAWRRWDVDGTLVLLETFENDRLHGPWRRWHDDGTLAASATYRDGKRHGPSARWYASGRLELRGAHRDGRRHGLWTTWHPTGSIAAAGNYLDGEREGRWTRWHATGQRASQGSYRDGKRHGSWTRWDTQGTLACRGRYRAGEPIGRLRGDGCDGPSAGLASLR